MNKTARISAAVDSSASADSSTDAAEGHPLVTIVLFCAVGLLISLSALLIGWSFPSVMF